MEFAAKLRHYMARARISQEVMGEIVGVSQNQVSRWQRGVNTPDIRQARALARELGVSLDHLLDDGQAPLSPGELEAHRAVARLARDLGVEESWRRLAQVPDDGPGVTREVAREVAGETPAPAAGRRRGAAG